ncbi:MAG: hypothetical protein IT462_00195 [Planctomycetes bacterium]|nr:hypothetical protein [Planctomycetota bacterium]
MPNDRYAGKTVTAACLCGWREEMSASRGGIVIECPRCAAAVTVPLFGAERAADLSSADHATLEQLTGRRFSRKRPRAPLFFGGALVGAAVACAALLTRPELRIGGALLCGLPGLWLIFARALRR